MDVECSFRTQQGAEVDAMPSTDEGNKYRLQHGL